MDHQVSGPSGPAPTTLAPAARAALAADLTLGAGNFLWRTAQVNPAPSEPILFLQRPITTLDGREHASFSLLGLEAAAKQYAAWYHSAGVKPKEVVGVYLDDGAEYLLHYLALTGLGAIPALTNGFMPLATAAGHFRRIGAVGIFTDAKRAAYLAAAEGGAWRFLVTEADLAGPRAVPAALPAGFPFTHHPIDPIMIAHSSGTTGTPKPVLLQHGPFFHGIRYRLGQPPTPGGGRILSSLPHSHNCAIAYIMLALLNGSPVYILSDHSGAAVLEAVHAWRPNMVVSFPQTFVEVTESASPAYDLSSVRLWMNGGDAAHETHIRKLLGYSPGSRFIDGMGSSEMGFSLFRHMHEAGSDRYDRCVGQPHPWVEAKILDDDGRELPPHQVGRLGVRGPSVTSGYWNDSALTYQTMLGGYWLTGDLAYCDEGGWFYHVDRVPDVVNTAAGPLYSLQTEELLMKRFAEISDCSVIGARRPDGDEARVLVRLRAEAAGVGAESLLARFNGVLKELGRPSLAGVDLVDAARVPLGATGKVLKRQLRDAYAGATHG